ncbi:methylenetetrahydrofolate reductase [Sphingopyxis sp.]|uniref:methylenetetrahydrofolate reductase n=1 Tax=Sphingopyxis sp. TaxID=1908224 RepID=UPI002D77991B|nr:methylenetetrahydrofolate reductase [Sphingopyxis sp.]HET6522881.1 methylenetetrahydrofolate reductase [Sphingopyxis sp.]
MLTNDYSLEITSRDRDALVEAAPLMPAGTRVSITFLPNEELGARVAAAQAALDCGFVPVPHLAARHLSSEAVLEEALRSLHEIGASENIFVIAGDSPVASGPYADALALIQSGLLERYGVRNVGIAGYPEGHPAIGNQELSAAMRDKSMACSARGMGCEVVTQFGFDAAASAKWLAAVRAEGFAGTVRIGIAGPTSVKALLRFATRCGVGASAKVISKYGASITKLFSTATPDAYLTELADKMAPSSHGEVKIHLYPFGGISKAAHWARDHSAQLVSNAA